MSSEVGVVNLCLHCGLAAPSNSRFCCPGCESVYQVLHTLGLERYYALKNEGLCFETPKAIEKIENRDRFLSWDKSDLKSRIYVEGIHCTACLWLIEQLPRILPQDILSARLDVGHSLLNLELTPNGRLSKVAHLLHSWGYKPHLLDPQDKSFELQARENKKALLDVGISGALMGNIMLLSIPLYSGVSGRFEFLFESVNLFLGTLSVFYSGRSFFRNVWYSFKNKIFSIDAPILLAIIVAYGVSVASFLEQTHKLYFDSISGLIFLLLASRYALSRLRQFGLGSKNSFTFLPPNSGSFQVGDVVTVTEDQTLAFDAQVLSGTAFVDNSLFNGESLEQRLQPGDLVYAGAKLHTLNDTQALKLQVLASGSQTRLSKIIEQVRHLHHKKSYVEQNFDRYAKNLLKVVLSVAALSFIYWSSQGQWELGLERVLTLLIITCPCALALATPLAFSLGLKHALKRGWLVKDPDVFEALHQSTQIVFDKTGTLTQGRMTLVKNSVPVEFHAELKALAMSSRHPVSRAIASALSKTSTLPTLRDFREILGLGSEAMVDGHKFQIRRAQNTNSPFPMVDFLRDEEILGSLQLKDTLKPEAIDVLKSLAAKYQLGILSGDRKAVVDDLCRDLQLPPQTLVFSEQTPESKFALLEDWKTKGKKVIFIGDGVNDALAMKAAHVSIAVSGSLEAAIQSAQVVFLKDDLHQISQLQSFAKKMHKLHKNNFVYSTAYNLISGILALSGVMNPLIAAIVMPLSAFTVFASTAFRFRKEAP